MRWRTPEGDVLAEDEIARALEIPPDGRIRLDDGRVVEARTFTLRSPTGEVKAFYGHPRNDALDDYLYVIDVHFVDGDVLYRGMLEIGGPGGTYRCRLASAVARLRDLRPIP